ncbi:MAG: PAS domain S-box protein, partial [Burkholderiales bacterium]
MPYYSAKQMKWCYSSGIVIGAFISYLLASQQITLWAGMVLLSGVIVLLLQINRFFSCQKQKLFASTKYNHILANALSSKTEFVMLVRKDGSLLYADSGYDYYFSLFAKKAPAGIATLIASNGISRLDKDKLYKALDNQASEMIAIDTSRILDILVKEKLYVSENDILDFPLKSKLLVEIEPILGGRECYFLLKATPTHLHESPIYLSEKVFPMLFDHANQGVITIREDGYCLYVNKAAARLLGYQRRELIKQMHPQLEALLSDNNGLYVRHKAGHFVPVHCYALNARAYSGDIFHTFLISPRAEQSSAETNQFEEHLWDFLEAMPIPEILMDAQGNIQRMNAAFRKITLQEGTNWNLISLLSEEHKNELLTALEHIEHSPSGVVTLEVQLKDKDVLTALLYINRMPCVEENVPYKLHAYIVDISEQKDWEVKFIHAQKIQAVGQLASGIAHDFNNLLTAMIGFCDLLLTRHPPGDPSFSDIIQIKQNGNRAANLVRQLLAFSRKQTIQPRLIEVAGVVAEIGNVLGRLIGGNIIFRMEYGHELGMIKVDPWQLEQVVMNLVVNARDAMGDEGGV